MWRWKIARHVAALIATVLLGAFLAALLTRLAPGFDTSEQQLDPSLSSQTRAALRAGKSENQDILHFYGTYLRRAVHGDLGVSENFNRPVRQLIAERAPVTARLVGFGLLLGWALALSVAGATSISRRSSLDLAATALAGLLLCLPAAVLGLAIVFTNVPAAFAIAAVVFPRVYRYTRNLLEKSYEMQHILAARATGAGPFRVFALHVVPISAGQLIALAGVSVSFALGAAIPVESLCGLAGIGQLAWQAAMARDLPLLVTVTVMVTAANRTANSGCELLREALAIS